MTNTNLLNSEAVQAASIPAFNADLKPVIGFDVRIRNLADIDGYLGEHPELRSLLPRFCEQTRNEFGRDAELTLGLYRDPEIDDRYLTLLVRQSQYEVNIVERLDQLAAQFANELDHCTGNLLVTTDFRPAR